MGAPSNPKTPVTSANSPTSTARSSAAHLSTPHHSPRSSPRPRKQEHSMEKPELLAYLQSQRLGVLGTLSPEGEPQGALVGYAITPEFEILFDTVRTSR